MSHKAELVKKGYNQIAHTYQKDRVSLKSNKYLHKFLEFLSPQSYVLDLGCGSGDPVDRELIKQGHLVIGLDISPVQIGLARKNLPAGSFSACDFQTLKKNQYNVDGVVSFYALFHVSREKHLELLKNINSFLPIGGPLLITMGNVDFEGTHTMFGTQMWSSQYDPEKNVVLMQQAGFEVLLNTLDRTGSEEHQILLGKKIKNIS